MKPSLNPAVADTVPWSDRLTPYDEEHFIVYLRLLDAEADGAAPAEMTRVVLGIDPEREPERAKSALESHLRRAQWVAKTGYLDLLRS